MKKWHYAIIVFLGGCCYGLLSTIIKRAYAEGFSIRDIASLQYLCGLALSWFVYLAFSRKKVLLSQKQILALIFAGIPMALTGIFYYQSLQFLDASLAIVFLFQFIWIGTFFEYALYRIRPGPKKIYSIFLLLIGSVLATNILEQGLTRISLEGALWGFLSAFTFALFIFTSGLVGKNLPPSLRSALMCTGACLIVCLWQQPTGLLNPTLLLKILPYGIALGLLGVLLPPLLFSIGIPHIGIGMGTMLAASELPVAVLFSALVLSEKVTGLQVIGVLLILFGIFIANIDRKLMNSLLKKFRSH